MKLSTSNTLNFTKTLALIVCLALVTFGCQKEMITPESDAPTAQFGGNPFMQRPIAQCGSSVLGSMKSGATNLGTAEMLNGDGQFYVIMDMNNYKFIEQIKIFVGDMAQLPYNTDGGLLLEAFPYQYQMPNPANIYTFTIPTNTISTCNEVVVWARVSTRNIFGQVTSTVDTWMSGTPVANGFSTPFCVTECTTGNQSAYSVD
jgi:hypothetical protein